MGFLNRALAQVNDLFKSLTPGTRIVAVLLLAAVLVSVAFLFTQGVSSGGSEYLLDGVDFSMDELPNMQAALGKAGLRFDMEGAKIRIPKGQTHTYMAALAKENALPANFGEYFERAATSDPLATSKTLEQRRHNGLQQELRATLRAFDGVQDAKVFLDEKKARGLGQKLSATASVTVRMKGNQPLTENLAETISRLVAGAYAGLDQKSVIVIDEHSHVSFGGEGSAAGASSEYLKVRQHYAQDYEARARRTLQYIPGVVVTVDVELNPEIEREQHEHKADPKSVPVRSMETTQKTKMESAGPGGRPGLAAQSSGNQAARLEGAAKGTSSSTEGPNVTEVESVVSTMRSDSRTSGLTPDDVRMLVALPQSYIDREWRVANKKGEDSTPESPEEKAAFDKLRVETIAKITDHLRVLLPDKKGTEDPTPNIQVTVFTDAPAPPITEDGVASQALAWFSGNWSTVGMFVLAGVSLLTVRSLARAGAPAPQSVVFEMPAAPPPPAPAASAPAAATAAPAEPPAPSLSSRRRRTGLTLRDELAELVREDPETAAGILRSWIGSAN